MRQRFFVLDEHDPLRAARGTTRIGSDSGCCALDLRKVDAEGRALPRRAIHLDLPASTVYRVLLRHDLNRLCHLDRQSATPIRRYERARPGELVHVDVKKLGRIPTGGGHRIHGRPATRRTRWLGYAYLHTAIDDHSRLAYTEVLTDEQGRTAAAFWRRAEAWFRARGVIVERVLTDNAFSYRGKLFNQALGENRINHMYCRAR